jgi:hypothetical protein
VAADLGMTQRIRDAVVGRFRSLRPRRAHIVAPIVKGTAVNNSSKVPLSSS